MFVVFFFFCRAFVTMTPTAACLQDPDSEFRLGYACHILPSSQPTTYGHRTQQLMVDGLTPEIEAGIPETNRQLGEPKIKDKAKRRWNTSN